MNKERTTMREIKFRAFNRLCGEMFSGADLTFEEYEPICDLLKDTEDVSFMQYTGMKDDDGVEIYEGDVVSITQKDSYIPVNVWEAEIVFKDYAWRFCDNCPDSNAVSISHLDRELHGIKVIGNIHEGVQNG